MGTTAVFRVEPGTPRSSIRRDPSVSVEGPEGLPGMTSLEGSGYRSADQPERGSGSLLVRPRVTVNDPGYRPAGHVTSTPHTPQSNEASRAALRTLSVALFDGLHAAGRQLLVPATVVAEVGYLLARESGARLESLRSAGCCRTPTEAPIFDSAASCVPFAQYRSTWRRPSRVSGGFDASARSAHHDSLRRRKHRR